MWSSLQPRRPQQESRCRLHALAQANNSTCEAFNHMGVTVQEWLRRERAQPSLILLVATLIVQSGAASPHHHLRPSHTRAKLSHGLCTPPNGLFNEMGKIITPGADLLKSSADECLGACE